MTNENHKDSKDKAKLLAELGICISMSHARRLASQMPQEKLDRLIQSKLDEKGNKS
jgi:hypothetical protein